MAFNLSIYFCNSHVQQKCHFNWPKLFLKMQNKLTALFHLKKSFPFFPFSSSFSFIDSLKKKKANQIQYPNKDALAKSPYLSPRSLFFSTYAALKQWTFKHSFQILFLDKSTLKYLQKRKRRYWSLPIQWSPMFFDSDT